MFCVKDNKFKIKTEVYNIQKNWNIFQMISKAYASKMLYVIFSAVFKLNSNLLQYLYTPTQSLMVSHIYLQYRTAQSMIKHVEHKDES